MTSISRSALWVRGGPNNGSTINLGDGLTLIGRAETNDIVVDEPNVSRQHAGLRSTDSGFWIEDMNSRNGTFVNGDEVEGEGVRLYDKDKIELGGSSEVHWIFRELGATVQIEVPTGLG